MWGRRVKMVVWVVVGVGLARQRRQQGRVNAAARRRDCSGGGGASVYWRRRRGWDRMERAWGHRRDGTGGGVRVGGGVTVLVEGVMRVVRVERVALCFLRVLSPTRGT